jgi:hypothetical protein
MHLISWTLQNGSEQFCAMLSSSLVRRYTDEVMGGFHLGLAASFKEWPRALISIIRPFPPNAGISFRRNIIQTGFHHPRAD